MDDINVSSALLTLGNREQNFTETCFVNKISMLEVINMTVLALVVLFGLVGNCMVVLIVYKNRDMRKNVNILISNLAISDSFVLVDDLLNGLMESKMLELESKELACKVFYFVYGVGPVVSLFTLLIISITRYRAVYKPMTVTPLSKKKLTLLIAGTWGVAIGVYAYDLVMLTGSKPFEIMPCDYVESALNFHYYVFQASFPLCIFLPISIINVLILWKLRQERVTVNSLPPFQRKARDLRIRSAVRMVLCSLVLYIILWAPLNILYTLSSINWKIFEQLQSDCFATIRLVSSITITLHAANSAFSPVVYVVFLEDFRCALKKLLQANLFCSTGPTEALEMNDLPTQNFQSRSILESVTANK